MGDEPLSIVCSGKHGASFNQAATVCTQPTIAPDTRFPVTACGVLLPCAFSRKKREPGETPTLFFPDPTSAGSLVSDSFDLSVKASQNWQTEIYIFIQLCVLLPRRDKEQESKIGKIVPIVYCIP